MPIAEQKVFQHLSIITVTVAKRNRIALIGSTGLLSTGDHLHFELWHKGENLDPTKYINF